MISNPTHALELFWLERRIRFLMELNRLSNSDSGYDCFAALASDFAKVEKPDDLIDRLRELYPDDAE